MENVLLFSCLWEEISVGVIYQGLDAFLSIIQHGIVQSPIPLLAFQVNVVGVPQNLQYILYISYNPFLTRKHQWCHFPSVNFPQIGAILDQGNQVGRIFIHTGIMHGFFLLVVFNIDDIGKDRQQFPQKFRIGIDGSTMDRWTVIVAFTVFDDVHFLDLVQDWEISRQKTVMLLGEVVFVALWMA